MKDASVSTQQLKEWARVLRTRQFAGIAVPVLEMLKVCGFVGGQVLWLLAPFVGEQHLSPLALTLENPDALQLLQQYLDEEETLL